MNIPAHLEKLRRQEALLARLDPFEDFELWNWVAMSAGTNALNAALHAAGVTSDRDCYPVRPNKYMEPGDTPGTWKQVVGPLGDLLHVDVPKLDVPVPPTMDIALEAMRVIEAYRDPCVRGTHPITTDLATACETAFRECVHITDTILRAAGYAR